MLGLLLALDMVHDHGMHQGILVSAARAEAAPQPGVPRPDRPGPVVAPAPGAPAVVLTDDAAAEPVRIFTPPPLRWDHAMANASPALHQGRSDFIALTGGVFFGLLPHEVNALLPAPNPSVDSGTLPEAPEFPSDVRYFWVPFQDAGPLRMGSKGCSGTGSYLVFLFSGSGLFRLSYRLVPDKACPSVNETARDIFARAVTIGTTVALSVRYRTGSAEVVDVTDPGASFLIPVRWYQVGR